MALYNFHRVLIAITALSLLAFSVYCYRHYGLGGEMIERAMIVGSAILSLVVFGYLIYFNSKIGTLKANIAIAQETPPIPCSNCGYDLRGTVDAHRTQCPECGHALPRELAAHR